MKKTEANEGIKIICKNKRALHDFKIETRYEAGLVLTGTEVKSCREGKVQLNDAYIQIRHGEAFLFNSHIAEYKYGNRLNHDPIRTRKLLLHTKEIIKLLEQLKREGETAIPLSLYFKNNRIKLEIGIGKGAHKYDKREKIQEREVKRQIERAVRSKLR